MEENYNSLSPLNLGGDGIIDNLYHYLWAKDPLFNSGPYILLPDTIIYKYGNPTFWYFTSKDGTLMRKSKKNVNNKQIEKIFLRKTSPNQIVAALYTNKKKIEYKQQKISSGTQSISSDNDDDSESDSNDMDQRKYYSTPLRKYTSKQRREDEVKHSSCFEYFNKEELLDFLYNNKSKVTDGVLQRFIQTKKVQKSTLSIIWSNKLCFFERRAIYYDGEKYHSQILPIRGTALPHRMQCIANSIHYHVANISRMVLHFRLDDSDQLNEDEEIAAPSLTAPRINKNCFDEKKMNSIPLMLSLEADQETRLFKSNSETDGKHEKYKYSKCYNCLEDSEQNSFYQISYKLLIQGFMNEQN